jgi:hypothetical protein
MPPRFQMLIDGVERDGELWYVVEIMLDGIVKGHGECPNTGIFKTENYAERTAIVFAWVDFGNRIKKETSVKRIGRAVERPDDHDRPSGHVEGGAPSRGDLASIDSRTPIEWERVLAHRW